jgi:phosphoglycolate phosphatase-like HAD superfamily hydrolase
MSLAFDEVFGVVGGIQGVSMAGRTDAWILNDAIAAHGITPDSPHLARFREVYVRHLATELEKPGVNRKGLMPGVRELLDALAPRDDVYLALLTGNYEAGARLKLEYFDLWRYFPCGAFGDDAPHRNVLVPKALARVEACEGRAFAPGETVVIGDTPLDVECAAHVGARSLAVATGSYSVEELRAAGADAALEDLSNIEEVVRMIGIRK